MLISAISVQLEPSYCSTLTLVPGLPATTKDAVCVPVVPCSALAVFKAPPLAQAPIFAPAPVHYSVVATLVPDEFNPPEHKAPAVVPDEPVPYLAVLKSPSSAQLVPFHTSVRADAAVAYPPPYIADEELVPEPSLFLLAVFISPTSVQDDPFQVSVLSYLVAGGVE